VFGTHFYHAKIRKSVALFGRLFNNIYVVRKNSAGAVLNQLKVPLAYAPKQKFLERIRENPELLGDTKVAIKLPRMSFEITSFTYDNTRQLTKLSNFVAEGSTIQQRQRFYSPVPYNINFQLNIYAKNQDDALQVVEQILPTFNPQYTLTIKPFPTEYPTFKEDIPIIIQSLAFSDDFEGSIEQRRSIIYTIDFEMKISFYGPVSQSDVIRTSTAQVFLRNQGANLDSDRLLETITTTPNPSSIIGMPDSDFGFNTNITRAFGDSA
tara:strand:- start:793 stop:1590 length:798 start_codon:yes stop_codon:yes gene_type:complete